MTLTVAPAQPATRSRLLLTVVGLAGFVTTLDNTVVTVALPSIQRDLHTRLSALEWVATGYILTFAGLMIAGGRLADVYGRRKVLLIGLTVFTGASLGAGLATSIEPLVVARLAQGVGAALILPATLAVLAGRPDRSLGVAIWMASGAGALALGPVVGGYLSQHAHWSWVFLINVPMGAAVIALATVAISETRAEPSVGRRGQVDVPGLLASVVFLASGTFALIHGGEYGWGSPPILIAVAGCVGGGVLFLVLERGARAPMVELGLFAGRSFTGGVLAQVLWGLGVNGVFFYTALFLQGCSGSRLPPPGWRSCRWRCSWWSSRRWCRWSSGGWGVGGRSPADWCWWRLGWWGRRSWRRGTGGGDWCPPSARSGWGRR
ncbi:MFS transporter [Nonomuraea sp. NPDC049028]|uniref:MFS transporter n=1 Tax=Nonomuraea sp. NPDC049028 TaxID=3364348 RepID=UPI003711C2A6